MARQTYTTIELIDDLDGSKADRTVTFSVDGHQYEIELSRRNVKALELALRPYVQNGRRVRRKR